jgi:hypothetical protein
MSDDTKQNESKAQTVEGPEAHEPSTSPGNVDLENEKLKLEIRLLARQLTWRGQLWSGSNQQPCW